MNKRLEYVKKDNPSGEYLYINTETLYIPDNLSNPTSATGVKKVYNMEIDKTPGWSYNIDSQGFVSATYTPDFQRTVGTKSIVTLSAKDHTISFSSDGIRYKIHTALFFPFIYPQLSSAVIETYLGLDSSHALFTSVNTKSYNKLEEIKANPRISNKIRKMFTNQLVVRDPKIYKDLFCLRHLPAFYWDGYEVSHAERERLNENPRQTMVVLGIDCSFRAKLYTPTDYSQYVLTPEYALGVLSRLLVFNDLKTVPVSSVGSGLFVVSLEEKIEQYHAQDRALLDSILSNTTNTLSVFQKFSPDKSRINNVLKRHNDNIIEVFDGENIFSSIRDSGQTQVVRTAKNSSVEEQLVNPYLLSVFDDVDVSEKDNIGNNKPLTMLAKSQDGAITIPLRDLTTGEIDRYLASEVPNFYVAEHNMNPEASLALIRHRGEAFYMSPNKATHQLVSPFASMSWTRASALYPEHQDLKRTQMTAVALKQSRGILRPERPLVTTGSDSVIANNESPVRMYATVQDVFEDFWDEYGIPSQDLTGEEFILKQNGNSMRHGMEYTLINVKSDQTLTASFAVEFVKGGSKSVTKRKIHPVAGDVYKPDDIVWSLPSFHITPTNTEDTKSLEFHSNGNPDYWSKGIGTGFNATVMYGFYKSYTVDDASAMSDVFIRNMGLHTPRTLVVRIPSKFYNHGGFIQGNHKPEGFNSNGLPAEGTVIKQGHPVFYYKQGNKQRCVYLKPSDMGEVFSVEIITKHIPKKDPEYTAVITLYNMVKVCISDKFSGRHGNKTLVAKIIPQEHMPYDPVSGKIADFILNPISIITRNNLGQIPEIYASLKQEHTGATKIDPSYNNKFNNYIRESVGADDMYERHLVDGETGVLSETKFFMGPMYMLRMVQIASDKIKSVGDAEETDLDNSFGSPVGSDPHNRRGQSLGAYEYDLLYSLGCRAILDEAQGIMSTDRKGRDLCIESIKNSGSNRKDFFPTSPGVSKTNVNVDVISRALYINIMTTPDGLMEMRFASDACNREFTRLQNTMIHPHLRDKKKCEGFSYIEFRSDFRFINPIAYSKLGLTEVIVVYDIDNGKTARLTKTMVDYILSGRAWFKVSTTDKGQSCILYTKNPSPADTEWQTKALSLITFLEETPWETFKEIQNNFLPPDFKYQNMTNSLDKLGGISAIISRTIPVIPLRFRLTDESLRENSFFTDGYWDLYQQSEAKSDFNEKHSHFLKMFGWFFLDERAGGQNFKPVKEFIFQKDSDGKLRNYITKKRLFYSMRANIIPQYEFHPDEIVLPFQHAVYMFSPFVISYMYTANEKFKKWNDFDIVNLVSVMPNLRPRDLIRLSHGLITSQEEIAKHIKRITGILEKQYVHYNRAPALQETSIRGGKVRIHFQGDFIMINTTLTTDFNADFDGDQMPVFAVFTEQGRKEVQIYLLPSSNVTRSNDDKLSLVINQDSLLGLYLLTENQTSAGGIVYSYRNCKDIKQALLDRKIHKNTPVNLKGKVDLACNHIIDFYSWGCSPKDRVITSKSLSVMYEDFSASYSPKEVAGIISDLLLLGYEMIHLINLTLSIKDFQPILDLPDPEEVLLPKLQKLLDLRKLGLVPNNITSHVTALIDEYNAPIGTESFLPKGNNLLTVIKSGAKGNFARLNSIFGVKGIAESNSGYFTTPVLSGYVRGISQIASDSLSFSQRKNAYATVEGTKVPGELFRDSCFLLYDMAVQQSSSIKAPHYIFYLPDGSISPVFSKVMNDANSESKHALEEAIQKGEPFAYAKTPLNDWRADGGIDVDHQLGTQWSEGALIGMKAATAMSANTTQMTISRRHYESGQDTSALNRYKSLITSGKMYSGKHILDPYKVISIYAPFDGYFHVQEDVDSTILFLSTPEEQYNIILDLDHTIGREYPVRKGYVKQGQCLSYTKPFKKNPYEAIHPIHSTNFYVDDRTHEKACRLDNPNQYQLQFGRFAVLHYLHDIHSATSDSIALTHFTLYASKLFSLGTNYEGESGYIGVFLERCEPFYVEMFGKVKRLFYTTGPMTAYMYQHPFEVAKLSICAGPKKDKSHMAKMMFSVPLSPDSDAKKIFKKPTHKPVKLRPNEILQTYQNPEVIVIEEKDVIQETDSEAQKEADDELIDLFADFNFDESNQFGD